MGARQYSLWLWLCQITTCLHEFETWNHAAWFVCVPYQMHNASRPWIIYINKWRKSVWFTANTLLLYSTSKAFFFLLQKKTPQKQNNPPYWRDRWQTGWIWVSYPKSLCDGMRGCHGNLGKMEQFVGLPWENMVVSWRTHIKSFTSVNISVLFWNTYLYIIYFIFSCIALFLHFTSSIKNVRDKREILGKSNIGIYNIHCRKELTIVNNKLVVSKYSDE